MKKFIYVCVICLSVLLFSTNTFATEANTDIPVMSLEELIASMQARQAKVDIIKKNNVQITALKEELKGNIIKAANKVNELKINISTGETIVSDEDINELKNLLEFLHQSTTTLNEEVEKVSKAINDILDLIQTRGIDLAQYDLLIEKQNSVIISMKDVMKTVNQI